MKNALLPLVLLLCCISVSATGQSRSKITSNQGRALVLASLTPKERQLPSLEAELYTDPSSSKFLFYTVTWAGTKGGSVVVGNYAVDPYTADVFSATVACSEQKNKRLEALQARVRSTLHLTMTEYRKIKSKGPLCEE
jgi:hypothetical protein